jgi:hypothetical protein
MKLSHNTSWKETEVKKTILAAAVVTALLLTGLAHSAEEPIKKKLPLNLTQFSKKLVKDKIELKSQDFADLDGDGRDEMVLVTQDKAMDRSLIFIHQNAEGTDYTRVYDYPLKSGTVIERMEIDSINGTGRPEVVLWLKDESPDEVGRLLSIHGFDATYHTMFENSFYKPKDQAPQEGGKAPAEKTVKLGPTIDELKLYDEDNDGRKEIVLPAGRKTVEVSSKTGGKTVFVTGARYEVYRYKGGMFVKEQDKVVSFLNKPLKPRAVDVSSEAMDKKTKSTIGPAVWISDSNIGSSWVPGGTKDGTGEWVKVWFEDRLPLRAIIVITGCMDSEDAWEKNNRIKSFTLEFSGGESVKIDRSKPEEVEHPVAGFKDVPRPETKGAVQTLIMMDEGFNSRNVKLEIGDVEKGAKGARTCIPEIMVY